VAQIRLDTGRIAGWAYHRATGSVGKETRCDYLITTRYENKFPAPADNTLGADLTKAGVKMTAAEYVKRRGELSQLVSGERVVRVDGFGETRKGDFFQSNYMKVRPGKMSDFVRFEREVWMPMAKAAAETDHPRKGWSLWMRMYPAGSAETFDVVTVDSFRTWDAIWQRQGFPEAIVNKVHPGKTIQQLFEPMGSLREIAHRQLWEVRDVVRPTGSASREAKR
jgi:hypothetical protein